MSQEIQVFVNGEWTETSKAELFLLAADGKIASDTPIRLGEKESVAGKAKGIVFGCPEPKTIIDEQFFSVNGPHSAIDIKVVRDGRKIGRVGIGDIASKLNDKSILATDFLMIPASAWNLVEQDIASSSRHPDHISTMNRKPGGNQSPKGSIAGKIGIAAAGAAVGLGVSSLLHGSTSATTTSHAGADPRWIDVDGDGVADGIAMDTNGDGVYDAVGIDSNQDGTLDSFYADTNGDGAFDAAGFDSNGDGMIDIFAADTNADGIVDIGIADTDFDGVADIGIADTDFDGMMDIGVGDFDGDGLLEAVDFSGVDAEGLADAGGGFLDALGGLFG